MMKKLAFVIVFCYIVIQSGCNPCRHKNALQNVDIPDNIKSAIFAFPQNTRWIFQSNLGDKDTVYVGAPYFMYTEEGCVDNDQHCCTKYNSESGRQALKFILDSDGLEKFTEHDNTGNHLLISPNISLSFGGNEYFNSLYKSTFTINGKTIHDIDSAVYQPWPLTHPTLPYKAYWSLQYGLVHYEYLQTDGTSIIYERIDL